LNLKRKVKGEEKEKRIFSTPYFAKPKKKTFKKEGENDRWDIQLQTLSHP